MTATLTFSIPQDAICVYTASAISSLLLNDKPKTRRGLYVFAYEVERLCWTEDRIAGDSAAWKEWSDYMRADFVAVLGEELTQLVEESIEVTVNMTAEEHERELAAA